MKRCKAKTFKNSLEQALWHCLAEHLLQGGIPASRVFGIVGGVNCILHVADEVDNLVALGSFQVVRPSQAILLGKVPEIIILHVFLLVKCQIYNSCFATASSK